MGWMIGYARASLDRGSGRRRGLIGLRSLDSNAMNDSIRFLSCRLHLSDAFDDFRSIHTFHPDSYISPPTQILAYQKPPLRHKSAQFYHTPVASKFHGMPSVGLKHLVYT